MNEDGSFPDRPENTDPFNDPSPHSSESPNAPQAFVPLSEENLSSAPSNEIAPAPRPVLKARLIQAHPDTPPSWNESPEQGASFSHDGSDPHDYPGALQDGTTPQESTNPAQESLATLEFINERCQNAPIMTYLLLATMMMVFCYGLSDKPLSESYFWKSMLSDQGLHHDELESMGGLYDGMLNPLLEYPRFLLSLFLHSGPWSLIFTLSILFTAGRYVERLSGPGQALFIFQVTGLLGNYTTMSVVEEYHALLFFPVGAWAGCFGLLGSQGGLSSRGILSQFPQQASRGVFGSMILVWILATLQFFPNAFNPAALAPIGIGLITAAIAGAILIRILPAWADDPESPGCVSLFLAFVSMFFLMVALVTYFISLDTTGFSDSPEYRNPNVTAIQRKAAILKNFKTYDDDKLKFSIQVPKKWKVLRKEDNYRTYGTESFGYPSEYIYLNIRDRHAYDAPDTLTGRFLNMMVSDWNLERNDVTVVFDEPFEHPTGKAHLAVFRIQRGNQRIRPGLRRSYYIILKDRVIFVLFFKPVKNDEGETAGSIIRSLKLLDDKDK
ncbi:MAG: rhomboid family intramembrane serine protease [Planctomycetota bacterium]|nr:rhomboid family intramembrane serine protease [Planctomycetota bacterium]